jgi:hypothetical protein
MITLLCVVASVFAYAFFRERLDRRKVERDRDRAWDRAGKLAAKNTVMELERAFRDGVEAASATNALYNRFMRKAVNNRGTIKLEGTRGAPESLDEWRRTHG